MLQKIDHCGESSYHGFNELGLVARIVFDNRGTRTNELSDNWVFPEASLLFSEDVEHAIEVHLQKLQQLHDALVWLMLRSKRVLTTSKRQSGISKMTSVEFTSLPSIALDLERLPALTLKDCVIVPGMIFCNRNL